MGNNNGGIKRIFQDKNTVTLLGVLAAILVLVFGYNMRVNKAINPIPIPCARETIKAGVQITEDMVATCQIPSTMISGEVIRNQAEVIDKYSRPDSIIPAGSYFYETSVVEEEQLPTNIILKYPDGYVLYNMSVNTTTVSKYEEGITSKEEADRIMLGKLIENVKVLAVKDASGQPVFANLDEQRTPAMIVFAVPEEYYILLKKAEYLRNYDTTLIPVPTNESFEDKPGKLDISSEDLKNWINRVTIWTDN